MKNYFKKFSIMLVMLLAMIGFGVIQNGSVANATTVCRQLLQPESGWKRIDDTDSKLLYSNIWRTWSYSELYNTTSHYIEPNESGTITFKFKGTKIRLMTFVDSAQSNNIKVTIDGVSEYYSSNYNNYMKQAITYEKVNLNDGIHQVIIESIDKTHQYILDAIDIDDTGYLVNTTESIALDKSTMDLTKDSTQQLIATTTPSGAQVTWTSSDSTIARVDSTGKVAGVKEGQATITATTADGLTATCVVTVTKENKSISLNKTSTNLAIDDSETLIATTTPAGISVKWSSSDTSIATVDSNGKVTAIGAGTATITATTLDGSNLSASCLVTVVPKGNGPTPADSENITNIAHAKGDNTNNPGGEVTIIFHGSADTTLSVVKTADVKEVWIGDKFTYTLVITNTGAKIAKAVVVNDPAPNHIDFNVSGITTTQGSVDSSSTSKNIIVNVGDILPGGTVTIKVPATVVL